MSLQITTRNIDLTEDLKEYVEKKVGKLSKFIDGTPDIHVILRSEKFRQIAEITVTADGNTTHGETQTNDMLTSLDKVIGKVQRQVLKEKRRTIAIKSRRNQEKKGVMGSSVTFEEAGENQ